MFLPIAIYWRMKKHFQAKWMIADIFEMSAIRTFSKTGDGGHVSDSSKSAVLHNMTVNAIRKAMMSMTRDARVSQMCQKVNKFHHKVKRDFLIFVLTEWPFLLSC